MGDGVSSAGAAIPMHGSNFKSKVVADAQTALIPATTAMVQNFG